MHYNLNTKNPLFSSLTLSGTSKDFKTSISHIDKEGVLEVKIKLVSETALHPPNMEISWEVKAINTLCQWRPDKITEHYLKANWMDPGQTSQSTSQAPVISLYDMDGTNKLTFALADCLHPTLLKAGVDEYSANMQCKVYPFQGTRQPRKTFEVLLYLDSRSIPFYQSLDDLSKWWAETEGYTPIPVPETGKLPVYSTWYSYHQKLTSAEIEEECRLSQKMGCASVIVDDGWQTNNSEGGYAFTGDWQAERLTDIAQSVQKIHNMGMKYILWYSVPFVGYKSSHYECFKNKLLYHLNNLNCAVLDPRYPDVRQYLIATYEQALKKWNLDGFKLDFVDRFIVPETGTESTAEGRDYDCVYEAADRLLSDVIDHLRSIKPDILIEFRQKYIGPLMRRYGNLFRAGDCPMDAITNRNRTIDIRLLAGKTATHSDMIMWHLEDSTEDAARQFLNILFSVPQISMRIAQLPESHKKMLSHYLKFWCDNRNVLLNGKLMPQHPEALYTAVTAINSEKTVIALYSTNMAELPLSQTKTTHIVNATGSDKVVVCNLDNYQGSAAIFNCKGELISAAEIKNCSTQQYLIPISGRMEITSSVD